VIRALLVPKSPESDADQDRNKWRDHRHRRLNCMA
jgi:hypothetical protein